MIIQQLLCGVSAAALRPYALTNMFSWGPTPTATEGSWAGLTGRVVLKAGVLGNRTSSKVRLRFTAATASTASLTKCYIGHADGTLDPYDFNAVPTTVTFNGGDAGFSDLAAGESELSDEIDFVYDGVNDIVVSFYVDAGLTASDDFGAVGSGADDPADYGINVYSQSGDSAITQDPGGTWNEATIPRSVLSGLEIVSVDDAYWGNVTLMLGFNGADDARPTDLDESPDALTNVWQGSTAATSSLEDSVKQLGSAAYKLLTDGQSDYAYYAQADVADLFPAASSGSYTWEGFFRIDTFSAVDQNDLFGMWSSDRGYILAVEDSRFRFFYSTNGSTTSQLNVNWTAGNIVVDTWYHLAVVKNGTTLSVYLDGIYQGGGTFTGDFNVPATGTFRIGGHETGTQNSINGYLDEWRFTKGVARYTGQFVVPTIEYPRTGTITEDTLTVSSADVDADLTDFVMMVDLSDLPSAGFWDYVTADGGNMRFYNASGTALPMDVLSIDTGAETGLVFIKVDLSSSSDTVITVRTVQDLTLPAATDTLGRNTVWSDYEVVYFPRDAVDRTGNGHSVTLNGNAVASGDYLVCDGTNDYVLLGGLPQFTDWTMACTISLDDATPTVNNGALSYTESGSIDNANRATMVMRASDDRWGIWNSVDSWLQEASSSAANTVKQRLAYSHEGTTERILYIDGAEAASDLTVAQRPAGSTPWALYVGAEDEDVNEELDGEVGFVYLRGEVLSAAWMDAEYTSWLGGSFYTVS